MTDQVSVVIKVIERSVVIEQVSVVVKVIVGQCCSKGHCSD